MSAPVTLPPYVRIGFSFYVTSPETGIEGVINVDGAAQFDPDALAGGLQAAIDTVNGMAETQDARGMTAEEVVDYLRRKREDEAGGDEWEDGE